MDVDNHQHEEGKMVHALRFNVQREGTGCFIYPNVRFGGVCEAFYALLDVRQAGGMGDKRYITELMCMIAQAPDFIDLHAHLSFAFFCTR